MPTSDRGARRALLALPLVLAACSPSGDPARQASGTTPGHAAATVPCARGKAPLTTACTVERTDAAGGTVLTLRAPDGGFRRLRIVRDGRGVVAADGAERATVAVADAGAIEVTLGGDRYRLPATIRR